MKWQVINGNNIDVLKTYEDNTFDSIITDPPYGIEFLGKDWDKNTGAMETWQECFRVLKPGGHLLAFSAARTYHHLATNVEMAGFEIRDQLMWLYGSGFPKAQDIGKAIDKRAGKAQSNLVFPKQDTRIVSNNGSPKSRKCVVCDSSTGPIHKNCQRDDCPRPWEEKADNEWAGWKTALKPAHEPIVMARKPMKGSTIDNVLEWGTGALNIDATRIPTDEILCGSGKKNADGTYTRHQGKDFGQGMMPVVEYDGSQGRFPANVLGEIPDYQKYFYCPKVSRAERHTNGEAENNHPTVKPVELMKYLIKLVTPAGGRVLDPFNGSGSTGMAAVELGYDYVGCELDPNYVEIANKRISSWEKRFDTPANKLFD